MTDLLHVQIAFMLWVQSINPALDSVFSAINLLQTEEFFIVMVPIIWWCFDKRIGASLAVLFLSSDYLVRLLKGVTGVNRPYDLEPRLRDLDPQHDLSFPSAGTMDTVILWGYLATQFRTRALYVWAGIAIVLIGLTRIYLGVHYPTDVVASMIIGFIILAVVIRARLVDRIAASPRAALWVAAIAWPVLLAFIRLNAETSVVLGALLGFSVGILIEDQWVHFEPRTVWWKQLLKLALGAVGIFALRLGIKPLLPAGFLSDMFRYTIIGLWLGAGAPWVFTLVRLSEKKLKRDVQTSEFLQNSEV